MRHIKLWIIGGLLALLGLLAFQNMSQVELTVLFWSFQTSRIVVIGSSFLLGGLVGWLLKAFWHPGTRR
ncbi:lipopolysaccharide assembly protein LapA domain-containing protein [uncultured Maricaulis sp.]|uniref:lipopolysaccharide assembly protein LapA domain-containing protein n=1 Tax=uncultured Maricaulis sp. TaxID=174710 RepID=UPI0030D94399|tara:strand:+ start:3913 stop:4119 length:207 start_codon:yes stop_codon:yes gene_type:complete